MKDPRIGDQPFNLCCRVIYGDVDGRSTRRGGLEIMHALPRHADQVLPACVRNIQSVMALAIGFCFCHFIHAAGQREQGYLIAGRRLIGGGIGNGPGNLRGKRTRGHQ